MTGLPVEDGRLCGLAPPDPAARGRAGSARPSLDGGQAAPRNTLLAALPDEVLARLRPHLERVPLRGRQVLQERSVAASHAWFIESGTASLVSRVSGRDSLEVGALGRDDLLGVSVVLGTARAPHRCVVQVPGEALRIRAEDLRDVARDVPPLRTLLLAYVQATLFQSTQLVVCNTYHTLQERLARLLLLTLDQLDGDEVALTHRALSRALGVRRAGVTTAIGAMEEAGLVRRGRGRIEVRDRDGLEGIACECRRTLRFEHRRLVREAMTDVRERTAPRGPEPGSRVVDPGRPPTVHARWSSRGVASKMPAPG